MSSDKYPSIFKTSRLYCELLSNKHKQKLIKLFSDKDNTKYYLGFYVKDIDDLIDKKINSPHPNYAIFTKDTDEFIGLTGYYKKFLFKNNKPLIKLKKKYTINIILDKQYQGHGYAFEVSKYFIDHFYTNKDIYSGIYKDNLPSIKLRKKLGFKLKYDFDDVIYLVYKRPF
jgi:RimJ/RimL family protein N-acetyltransferase